MVSNEEGNKIKKVKMELEFGMNGFNVKPEGNMFMENKNDNSVRIVKDSSLGLLRVLPDEQIISIFALLDVPSLLVVAQVSKYLHVFSSHDDIWKPLVTDTFPGNFQYSVSWKTTYFNQLSLSLSEDTIMSCNVLHIKRYEKDTYKPFPLTDIYSDYVFISWMCASMKIPERWIKRNNIARRSAKEMSVSTFIKEFEELNIPVLITDAMHDWPCYKDPEMYSRPSLLAKYGKVKFTAGPLEMTLQDYYTYADNAQEERPFFIFDKQFSEKTRAIHDMDSDYRVPSYFSEDLFQLLGAEERPDYRWLILGPSRSGSSWHIDPNATSAYNAVVKGAKKWILMPPGKTPPGVFKSTDGTKLTAPVSINEWFRHYYDEIHDNIDSNDNGPSTIIECICKAGEIVFVPSGWYHCVLNLDDSIAFTQNYVSRRNLNRVLHFLKTNPTDVSGCRNNKGLTLYARFTDAFKATFPEEHHLIDPPTSSKVPFWDTIRQSSHQITSDNADSFCFDF